LSVTTGGCPPPPNAKAFGNLTTLRHSTFFFSLCSKIVSFVFPPKARLLCLIPPYTLQRYLDPTGWALREIYPFFQYMVCIRQSLGFRSPPLFASDSLAFRPCSLLVYTCTNIVSFLFSGDLVFFLKRFLFPVTGLLLTGGTLLFGSSTVFLGRSFCRLSTQ